MRSCIPATAAVTRSRKASTDASSYPRRPKGGLRNVTLSMSSGVMCMDTVYRDACRGYSAGRISLSVTHLWLVMVMPSAS
jgi:hypothetical protein